VLAELFLQTALAFLSREVPRWSRENHCYSCHNNGDAARALYVARQRGYAVPAEALADTTAWLLAPAKWDEIHGAPAAGDKKLGRIQFAAALAEAFRTGAVRDEGTLRTAAESLVKLQDADGSWHVDTGGLPGAPVTYGTALATYMARRTLETAGGARFAAASSGQPAGWRRRNMDGPHCCSLRAPCRLPEALLEAQTGDGGWGVQPRMPAEAFDTAMVLLALRGQGPAADRGRRFLIKLQDREGAWPETTRPSGGQSYAERISTAGWVVYALLEMEAGNR
jgi:hypothetical protein